MPRFLVRSMRSCFDRYRLRTLITSSSASPCAKALIPQGFDLPGGAEGGLPLQTNIDNLPLTDRAATSHEIVARLKPGMSVVQADAELKAIDSQLEQEYPEFRRGWSQKVISLRQE